MAMDRKKHAPTTVTEQLHRIQGLEGFYHGKFVKEDGNMLHLATGSNVSSSTNCLSYGCELHGNTYELGISLDFGLAPDVSMYHFPPLILTGKGFTKETLTSKSWPTLASPRVI